MVRFHFEIIEKRSKKGGTNQWLNKTIE